MGRAGGTQEMEEALVITSEEDIQTVSISIISGEVLKVGAEEARKSWMWVDKLRPSTSMFMVDTATGRTGAKV